MADPSNAGEHAASGLPQFDLAQWPGQMVWMLVIFAVLIFLFAKVFVPKIGGTIAAREDKIGGDIGQARRLRDEAEAQAKAAADELAQARARAQRLGADAKSAATAEAEKRAAEEEARLATVLEAAEGRIHAARAEAMGQVGGIAADGADAIVTRLNGQACSAGEVDRALASVS